ncbi:nucleoside deaminase [Aquabacterium soli]|uniref:Nucleoside deaminase n=1 Tax=Aquabacterium soli TaxID=2493092 RepID=A0A3R8T329_9BURK|nr:nucleoside deaminase [Aquabacterium soli]RRS04988.1 nucleoside deaminase [Aquabacterium soli]
MTSFTDDDTAHMQAAIHASRQAVALGNMPFGATLVKDGQRLQVSRNEQVTSGDCMAHAEVVAVRDAVRVHGRAALRGATMYASGEPCAMCCGAMFWAGITRVVYAATLDDIILSLGDPTLAMSSKQLLATASPTVQVEGPLLREPAARVLQDFAQGT